MFDSESDCCRPLRAVADLSRVGFDPQSVDTNTSKEQLRVESHCLKLLDHFYRRRGSAAVGQELRQPLLNRQDTVDFLLKGLLRGISSGYQCLDASRPWLVYWILQGLRMCGHKLERSDRENIWKFVARCQNADGGFGGGPGQLSHLAPTYASVNALSLLDDPAALDVVDRAALARWLRSLWRPDGSFVMHSGGEVDIRGVYCALSVARLTHVYTEDMFKGTELWVVRCQTYEGGFGGAPGMEAHGGYSFCGLAALVLMGKARLCDTERLLRWAANRQMRQEGGFQGRTNKLVDGCYSFWQGGIFPLMHRLLEDEGHGDSLWTKRWLFDQEALQEYLLICAQDPRGGLVDKPGKTRDFYHTCYALSGLSVAQHPPGGKGGDAEPILVGGEVNLLEKTHPVYNVCLDSALEASEYFASLGDPGDGKGD